MLRFEDFTAVTMKNAILWDVMWCGEGHLSFLDLDIYRRLDGSLGHKVYRKPTHTPISTSAPSPIITHPISKEYYSL
jgi:hypothetical protein